MRYHTIISAEELEPHLTDPAWVIIDCRFSLDDPAWGSQEFAKGHVPGAQYAHLDNDLSGKIKPGETGRHPLPADWDAFAQKLGKWGIGPSSQVVVYDVSHGGVASRLWWMLHYLGHDEAAVLDGGWAHWIRLGKPVTSEETEKPTATFEPVLHPEMTVDMQQVLLSIDDEKMQVIDSRSAERYAGLSEPIDPVAGHIPGAVNFPFLENVDEMHLWKPKDALKLRFESLFDEFGPEAMIVHCGSGVTACQNLLAMKHAGFEMPKLYPGSWSEWITDRNNPVVPNQDL